MAGRDAESNTDRQPAQRLPGASPGGRTQANRPIAKEDEGNCVFLHFRKRLENSRIAKSTKERHREITLSKGERVGSVAGL